MLIGKGRCHLDASIAFFANGVPNLFCNARCQELTVKLSFEFLEYFFRSFFWRHSPESFRRTMSRIVQLCNKAKPDLAEVT